MSDGMDIVERLRGPVHRPTISLQIGQGITIQSPGLGYHDHDDALRTEAATEITRLRAEVASLRLTLGGRTFNASVPEPIGCPLPGACAQVAEISRLRAELAAARDALEIISGRKPPFDYLLGNADHAESVLKHIDKMKGTPDAD